MDEVLHGVSNICWLISFKDCGEYISNDWHKKHACKHIVSWSTIMI